MDTVQWPQGIGLVKSMEEASRGSMVVERRSRPQNDIALNCPRCNSTNTKFCYYNNYSLSQPRYFCKTCRRYWTEGGSLRNVPVGGGSRKNKRPSSFSSLLPPPVSSKKLDDLQNPKIHEGQDLNLAYPPPPSNEFIELPYNKSNNIHQNPSNSMELLKSTTGINSRDHLGSFMSISVSDSNTVYSSGFPIQDFKPPTLNFSLDGFETGYGVQENGTARLLFPMEELKQVRSNDTNELEQNRGQGDQTSGYWSGMFGGGHW